MYNKCDRRAGYEIAITMHTIIQMHHRHSYTRLFFIFILPYYILSFINQ